MSSSSRSGIPEDPLELSRQAWESTMQQHADQIPVFVSSSYAPSADSSVEIGRHRSAPSPAFDFSFHDGQDEVEDHQWSYRSEAAGGMHSYGGHSTAAHHASALTFSAGLAHAHRRDPSESGAEYDPDRPLGEIIDGIDSRFSLLDIEHHKPRPVDLDRVLQSGYLAARISPSARSAISSSASDTDSNASRPRLADALHRSFSPSRPFSPHRHADMSLEAPTPRPIRRQKPTEPQPQQGSATFSSGSGSNFTKAARQLKHDLNTAVASSSVKPARSHTSEARTHHTPARFTEPVRAQSVPLEDRPSVSRRVRLPDVTGLTSAVGSPPRPFVTHRSYSPSPNAEESPRDVEERLRSTLAEVQRTLAALQSENGKSRSKVLSLEAEVEAVRRKAGRSRARTVDLERYESVLEEKERLVAYNEKLTATISRLQETLAAHREELAKLRGTVRDREQEVRRLAREVERLRGEVQGLKASLVQAETRNESEEIQDDHTEVQPNHRRQREHRHIRRDRHDQSGYATAGSMSAPQYVGPEEISQINAEMEERRSEISATGSELDYTENLGAEEESEEEEEVMDDHEPRSEPQARAEPSLAGSHRHKRHSTPPPESFPRIRGAASKRLFPSVPPHDAASCASCRREARNSAQQPEDEGFAEEHHTTRSPRVVSLDPEQWRRDGIRADLPPQTVLARALRELEDDFSHFKSIYVELAEQYAIMDAAAIVQKRNLLAEHLKEVIDTLEQKGDQIAALYDLLEVKNRRSSAGSSHPRGLRT